MVQDKEEEEYLMGIQDVIGRVPMFGGSAADDNVEGKWKIICNDKVISDGVAVAFFYTDNEIETSFTGAYRETNNVGIVTKVDNNFILDSNNFATPFGDVFLSESPDMYYWGKQFVAK